MQKSWYETEKHGYRKYDGILKDAKSWCETEKLGLREQEGI